MYRNDAVVVFDRKIVLKLGFEKMVFFNKIPFLCKAFNSDYFIFIKTHHP